MIKRDVGRMLLALEQLQQERIEAATATRETKVELTEAERAEAMELLRDPHLLGAHPGRLPDVRPGGRRDQQARLLPGLRLAAPGAARWPC